MARLLNKVDKLVTKGIDNYPEMWDHNHTAYSAATRKGNQMEQITIAGKTFNAPLRYEEGHELSAGEAAALNQTYHENLRNNFAKKVKDASESGAFDQDAVQQEFYAYAEEYQFGVRTGGGSAPRDPVIKEALDILRDKLRAALKKKGKKADASVITMRAKELLPSRPDIMELAKKRVAEAQALASDDLADIVADMQAEAAQ